MESVFNFFLEIIIKLYINAKVISSWKSFFFGQSTYMCFKNYHSFSLLYTTSYTVSLSRRI